MLMLHDGALTLTVLFPMAPWYAGSRDKLRCLTH